MKKEKTIYISKMQAKQLLKHEIEYVERIIPECMLPPGTVIFKIKLSD